MSEQDFARSSSSNNELAADSREATVVEALDPHRVESADGASWGSDSPQMRSMRAKVSTMALAMLS
jgi:hypothetical protein